MIRFETSDGVALVGDLCVPAQVRAAAIVCHPHPQFGGNRFSPVVEALFNALADRGIATLRFDFRAAFDDGRGERLDAEAALEELRGRWPDVVHFATGYSFGAMIALSLEDGGLDAKVLVAPPLTHTNPVTSPEVATLVLTPAHDQFTPPEVARPIVDTWPDAEYRTIESVDHFFATRATFAADLAAEWLEGRLGTTE